MKREGIEKMLEKYITHYDCEDDPWYGCPKSLNGCYNDNQGEECNCGRDKILNKAVEDIHTQYQQDIKERLEGFGEKIRNNILRSNAKSEYKQVACILVRDAVKTLTNE